MLKDFITSLGDFFFSFSAIHTIISGIKEQWYKFKAKQADIKRNEKNQFLLTLINFIRSFGVLLIIMVVSIAFIIILKTPENKESPSPKIEPTCMLTPAPITSWPIKRSAMDSWLDEMDGYVSHDGVFFMHSWDDYHPIKINDQLYPHCIGIRIPIESQNEYYAKVDPDQLIHTEYIEYSLGYSYKTLQFDYAIDDITFPDASQGHPRCEFRIVVDSCSSSGYILSDQKHLFDTDWLNYRCRCAVRTSEMDVSQCETVRITVMWRFYMRKDGPISFNLAIMNPLLRAARIK